MVRRASLLALALALPACGQSEGTSSPAPAAVDASPGVPLCRSDSRAKPVARGAEQRGTRFTLKLLALIPDAAVIGSNRWSVLVSDAAGAPVNGATLALTPTMPDRGEASPFTPQVAADPGAGQFTVSGIVLPIAGVWSLAFDITAAGVKDQVVYTVCVDP